MKKMVCVAPLLLLAACFPAPGQSSRPAAPPKFLAEFSASLEELAASASPAVVQILVQRVAPLGKGDLSGAGFVSEQESTGSGIIVDPSGYIITNAHVVQNARRIEVKVLRINEKGQMPHGHTMTAKLVGLDEQVDIAVVKVEGSGLPTLPFLDSDKLRQGQFVVALGSPLGLQNSLSHGVISATARQLKAESPVVYIQTDASINPGNSGGPLLDINGRIAGINTMIYSESGGNEGIGFAIPANLAKEMYERLRTNPRIRRGVIGVIPETITQRLGTALGLDRDSGVILSDVAPHGPADAAGLQTGDVVLTVDGKPMSEARDFTLAVFERAPGGTLKLEIQRGKQTLAKNVAIIERDSTPSRLEDQADYATALVRQLGILAVTVDEKVTPILPNLRRLSGVAVAAVPAEYAGLNPGLTAGDVIYELNNRRLATVADLRDALKDKSGQPIAMLVERQGQLVYVTAVPE
jgi:serine protease Do